MSEGLSKDVPSFVIVLLIANGFFFSFLSPIFVFLNTQSWVNPLIQNTPSESLSSIALILLFALIAGLPGLLLRDYVTGRNGPISLLNVHKRKREEIGKQDPEQYMDYDIWLKSTGLDKYLSFLNLKYAIVNGFLLGSELAFIVNIIFAFLLFLVPFKEYPLFISVFINSFLFFSIALIFEKYFFRNSHNAAITNLNKRYKDATIEQKVRKYQSCGIGYCSLTEQQILKR
jgi:hypothetical protein